MATQDQQRCVWALIVFVLGCCCTLGIPIRRDVPDDVVYTDLHKTVELGSGVALKCQFHGTPLAVYWKKGDNPSTSPNLITWVEGEVDSGSCIRDKTCEMGDDFSLIIKNVSIADQGRYICRLSNNLGILRHNTTDVRVYASPEEPFPVIKECEENQGQNCTFPSLAPMNITCTSSRYFPHIDLFFLRGSQKFTTLKTWTSTNSDGTKNKSIFTIAPPSKKPYVCVAFNIPGFHDQRTTTVSFPGHSATNDTDSSDENDGPFQIKIVVPISVGVLAVCGFAVIVACCCICLMKCRKNHNPTRGHDGTDEETTPLLRGHRKDVSIQISPEEFEEILQHVRNSYDVTKFLRKVTKKDIKIEEEQHVLEFGISKLTEWNRNKLYKVNPYVLLSFALESVGCTPKEMMSFWVPGRFQTPIQDHELTEFTIKLTERHCKRLLIYLKLDISQSKDIVLRNNHYVFDTKKMIADRLLELKCSNYEKRCKLDDEIIKNGRYDLQDHFGTIKARQEAGFPTEKPHPDGDQFDTESIFDDDVTQLVKLIRFLPPGKKVQYEENIGLFLGISALDGNVLEKRIKEWRNNIMANCPKDQSLNHFRSFRQELTDNADYSALTLTDEEIENIVAHVTSADKESELISRHHIKTEVPQKRSDQLKMQTDISEKTDCHDRPTSTFRKTPKNVGLAQGIMSKSTSKRVTHEELPRIALDLVMEDVRPIIKALDIDQKVVSKYVKQWDGKSSCTIDLVMKLQKKRKALNFTGDRNREDYCKALGNMGFVDVARSVYYGLLPNGKPEQGCGHGCSK